MINKLSFLSADNILANSLFLLLRSIFDIFPWIDLAEVGTWKAGDTALLPCLAVTPCSPVHTLPHITCYGIPYGNM